MTNLVKALAAATLAGGLLAGCETNPSKSDATPNLGSTTPQGMTVNTKSEADAQKAKSVPPATFQWTNPKENCSDPLTENKIQTNKVRLCITQGTAVAAQTAAAAKPVARTDRKNAMPGTKDVAAANAPVTNAPVSATAKIDQTKPQTIFAATVTLSECGVTAGGVAASAGGALGGLGNFIGGLAGTVTGAAKQAANRAAGGGISGRMATEATTAVTGTATQTGRRVANDKQEAVSSACSAQISDFINTTLKAQVANLSNKFAETHVGAKPAYTITSELPAAYENQLKAAVGEPVTAHGRAPR